MEVCVFCVCVCDSILFQYSLQTPSSHCHWLISQWTHTNPSSAYCLNSRYCLPLSCMLFLFGFYHWVIHHAFVFVCVCVRERERERNGERENLKNYCNCMSIFTCVFKACICSFLFSLFVTGVFVSFVFMKHLSLQECQPTWLPRENTASWQTSLQPLDRKSVV